MILVCPLSQVGVMVARHKPGRVISLLDPHFTFPELGPDYEGRHLRLRFHDVHVAGYDEIAPSAEHVDQLLEFLSELDPEEDLLIHCRAGISRSTAAAFIAACYLNPEVPERDLALALRRASPPPAESGDGGAGRCGDGPGRQDERGDCEHGTQTCRGSPSTRARHSRCPVTGR